MLEFNKLPDGALVDKALLPAAPEMHMGSAYFYSQAGHGRHSTLNRAALQGQALVMANQGVVATGGVVSDMAHNHGGTGTHVLKGE